MAKRKNECSPSRLCYADLATTSNRFDVFVATVKRNPSIGYPRDVYTAWERDVDVPYPVCMVTINPAAGSMGNYVEWIWTHELHRRKGVATEVLRAIERLLGSVTIEGVTDAGEAFEDAFCSA